MFEGTAPVFLCIPPLLVLFALLFISYLYYRKPKDSVTAVESIELGQLDPDDGAFVTQVRQIWPEISQNTILDRLSQETNPIYGTPLWLSCRVQNGRLYHWALLVHKHKYELRRPLQKLQGQDISDNTWPDDENGFRAEGELIGDVSNASGFAKYYEKAIKDYAEYDAKMVERERAIRDQGRPTVKIRMHPTDREGKPMEIEVYLIHIGWTRKDKTEVDEESKRVWASFGSYNLLTNNCQHFVKKFATRIVYCKSQDWNWFLALAPNQYFYTAAQAIQPDNIILPMRIARTLLKRYQDALDHGGITDRAQRVAFQQIIRKLNADLLAGSRAFMQLHRNASHVVTRWGVRAIGTI